MPARWFLTLFVLGLLLLPATALGGGWATVGVSSTPEGLGPGQPWNVDLEVLQHGQTPLAGVQPTVTITHASTGATRTFTAHPTAKAGVYRASVVFPSGGSWTYKVNDGFSQVHQFAQVRIAGPAQTAAPGYDGQRRRRLPVDRARRRDPRRARSRRADARRPAPPRPGRDRPAGRDAGRRMSPWVAPVVAGIIAGGATFAAGAALSADDDPPKPVAGATIAAPASEASGAAVFARMACGGCHTLAAANSHGQFAPNLDERLPAHTRASLKAKITNPYPGQQPGRQFVDRMPTDFADRMTEAELDALITYLLASAKPAQSG